MQSISETVMQQERDAARRERDALQQQLDEMQEGLLEEQEALQQQLDRVNQNAIRLEVELSQAKHTNAALLASLRHVLAALDVTLERRS